MAAKKKSTPLVQQADSVTESTERVLLGCVIVDNELWSEASGLDGEDFVLDSHRLIFGSMKALADAGKPIDFVTIQAELASRHQLESVGGAVYVSDLCRDPIKRKSIKDLVSTIKTAWAKRFGALQFESLSGQCMNGASVTEVISQARIIADRLSGYECTENGIDKLPDPLELPQQQEPWLVHGLLLRGGVTLLTGAPGDGKTFLALSGALAVAFDKQWLGRTCENTKVLILDRENPRSVIQQRWKTIFDGPVKGFVSIWAGWSGLGEVPSFDDPRLLELAKKGYLLIFDSLVRFHDGDENSVQEMAVTTKKIRALANAGASVLLIHHRGKSEINKYRGSSEILANSDIACSLSKSDDGLLTLDVFKTRGTSEFKLTIRPDFENGEFQVVDSPAKVERQNEVEKLAEIISSNPGLSQSQVQKQSGINRNKACSLLEQFDGAKWKSQSGPRNALLYFPIATNTSCIDTGQYTNTGTCTSTAAFNRRVLSTGQEQTNE